MFKWPRSPHIKAKAHELADCAELQCRQNHRVSRTFLNQNLGRMAEHDYFKGVPEEKEWTVEVDKAMEAMQRHTRCARKVIRFVMDDAGTFACCDTGQIPHLSVSALDDPFDIMSRDHNQGCKLLRI